MKKIIFLIIISTFVFGNTIYANEYYIGVVTGEKSQSKDSYLGAERLERDIERLTGEGYIEHVTFSYCDSVKKNEYKDKILKLAKDPKMKAIVVVDPIKGTYDAFKEIKSKYPKIILVASNPYEKNVSEVADIVLNRDNVARGYLIVKAAQEMGAKKVCASIVS